MKVVKRMCTTRYCVIEVFIMKFGNNNRIEWCYVKVKLLCDDMKCFVMHRRWGIVVSTRAYLFRNSKLNLKRIFQSHGIC